MKFRLAQPRLEVLDELEGTCLLLTSFGDDRPLRGLTGLVDWRLNGQLSRLLRADFVDGHYEEAMFAPIDGRLPFRRLMLIGLGRRSDYTAQRFEDICRFCFKTMIGVDIYDFAMMLPGRIGFDVGLRQALAGWRRAVTESFTPDQLQRLTITLLEPSDVQKELVEPLRLLERELTDVAAGRTGHKSA